MRGPPGPMSAPLALVLALQVAPSPPGPAPTAPSALARDELTHRRLVLANTYALEFGVRYPVPSGVVALLLGTDLRPRLDRRRRLHRLALGYQLSLALGRADLVYAESPANRGLSGLLTHRHALAMIGRAGAHGRLFHALALAAVFGGPAPVGLDGELRLGHILGARPGRVHAVIGGQLRVGAPFAGPLLPQFGLFLGLLAF